MDRPNGAKQPRYEIESFKKEKSATKENTIPELGTSERNLIKRSEIYSCLCKDLNIKLSSYSAFKLCFNSLFASPCYMCFIYFIFACLAIVTIAVLAFLIINYETSNKSYFAFCKSNSDCNSLIGLQCSAENGLCNCPAVNTKGHCDCNVGYYWNGVKCTQLMQYLDTGCSADFMCDQTKYLVCLNNTCTCGSNKVIDSTKTCKYNYMGCYNDFNSFNSSWYIYSQYIQMFYFVDTCIETCTNLQTTYSAVYVSGSSTRCWCLSSYFSSTPATCDIKCIGKKNELYPCGSSSSIYNRAIYQN